jgi:hypothetical protein
MTKCDICGGDHHPSLSTHTADELRKRARPVSQGGVRPDGVPREEWRTKQGAFYDDDRN